MFAHLYFQPCDIQLKKVLQCEMKVQLSHYEKSFGSEAGGLEGDESTGASAASDLPPAWLGRENSQASVSAAASPDGQVNDMMHARMARLEDRIESINRGISGQLADIKRSIDSLSSDSTISC